MRTQNRATAARASGTPGGGARGGARRGTGLAAAVRALPGASGWRDEHRRPRGNRRSPLVGWWRPARASEGAVRASAAAGAPANHPRRDAGARQSERRRPLRPSTPARRAPSNPTLRRLRRVAALVALASLAVAGLMAWVLTAPTWQVRHLRIEGTHDPMLLAAVRALPLTGCNAFRCDPAGDAALLERVPAVAHADVAVVWPDTLAVRVVARVPLVIWRVEGQSYVVASDGVLLGSATTADAERLPRVDDPRGAALGAATAQPGARLPAALVGVATQLLSALPEVLGQGVTLRYTARAGLVAADGQGLEVAFGDPTRPPNDAPQGVGGQLAELHAVLDLLQRQGQQAGWIDLRWGWHPYYRLAGT
jgi:hypothetical protein